MTSATATPRRRRAPKSAEAEAPAAVTPEAEAPDAPEAPDASETDSDASETGESRAVTNREQASRALSIPGISATFTERSLTLPEKLTIKGWLRVVEAIDTVREGARWWWGDAIIQGESRWGDTYSQALDAGKYNYDTLRALVSCAKRYPPAERIYDLSWSHYHAAMGVPLDVARDLLVQASADDWSVMQVRERVKEIKSARAVNGTGPAPTTTTTNGATVVRGLTATPRPEDLPGIKPLTAEQVIEAEAAGRTVEQCGGCDNLFAEKVWHCVGCMGHWPLNLDECPNERCGMDTGATTTQIPETPAPATRTVAGTVITAADNGADQALTVLMSFPFADLDPSDIAASLMSSDVYADPMASLMSLHNWLGQVIEAAASDDDEPEAPGRDAEAEAEEADEDTDAPEDGEDGLGDLFGDTDDDDTEGTDEEAEDDENASESPVTASQAAPAPAPAASKPLSPAPKPGASKPVRRRSSAAV